MNRMKTMAWTAGAALAALLALTNPAVAQVTATGTIEIVVQDQGGLAVPGVNVVAQATDSVTKRDAVTDGEGRAVLVGLAPSAIYVVTTELAGFTPTRNENVLVRSGQTAIVRMALTVGGVTEQVQVTADSPIVDVGSATTGQDITLQLTESLPTGRSYQSYLQLVPGVLPDDPQQPGNPASKSGVNYSDIAGDLGVSSDNFYYFNGINVTDPITGTFGANLNTEIIQEQKVLTGGIPAEFVGTPGPAVERDHEVRHQRASRAPSTTSSRTTTWWRRTRTHRPRSFSTFDAAGTIGGPIVRNQAWFFGSYRRIEREDDVTSLDTQQFLRTVEQQAASGLRQGHLGADQQRHGQLHVPERSDDISGRRDRNLTNARDRSREQGGNNYAANYSRIHGRPSCSRRPTTSTTARCRTSRPSASRRTRSSTARPTCARWPTSSSAASVRT